MIFQIKHDFLEIINSFSDPYEINSTVDNYTINEFMTLAEPFIKFMAYGVIPMHLTTNTLSAIILS